MKPGKELFLLKVSLVFILIEISITTFSYSFILFLLVCKLYKLGLYIMHYIWEMSRYTNIGIYLVLTYVEKLYRLSFLSIFAVQ